MSVADDAYQAIQKAFDAPWPGPRGDRIVLGHDDLRATVYPADGCRIASLTAFGYEVLRSYTPERRGFQYGCFPMVPWVGRVRNGILHHGGQDHHLPVNKPPHAMHGMACFGPWDCVEASGTSALFRLRLTSPWPWSGQVTQRFSITDTALDVDVTIESDGQTFPAAAGWHPWFRKWLGRAEDPTPVTAGPQDEALRVRFAADWQEEPDDNELYTGRRIAPQAGPYDDCFGFNGAMSATLDWPDKLTLDMSSPTSTMVVFDKQPDATCVEPLSGPPNGVNTAPTLVSPAQPLRLSTRWLFTKR